MLKYVNAPGIWWLTPLIPALGRQRQMDLCEFEASLVYRASSRTGSKATEKPIVMSCWSPKGAVLQGKTLHCSCSS